jgi:uncharacterized membrane protein YoaK (UPF0700 family)
MFRHRGEARTLGHNLRVASLLSFVAGLVNIAGFLSVQRLTTNVTGHFAFFIDEFFKLNLLQGFIFFLYIFFFFLGSFTSSFIIELIYKKKQTYNYVIPVLLEGSILLVVAVFGVFLTNQYPDVLAFLLLFAMGLQNSLVTSISNSIVRTTHLTGLFTDLGIELSQLYFYTHQEQKTKLKASIKLRLTIISFFFIGGIVGGIFYSSIQLHILFIAGAVLFVGAALDRLKQK